LEDISVDGKIILKFMAREQEVWLCTALFMVEDTDQDYEISNFVEVS